MDHQSSSGLLLKEEDYECALCLRLLFEPSTLRCGHSFCRTCCESLYKQNHAKCPTCRKVLPLIYNSSPDSLSISFTLSKLLEAVFPKEYHQRRLEHEEESNKEQQYKQDGSRPTRLPIFYLDPMVPRQQLSMNIFEPRYILMITRCLEGSRHFGMVGSPHMKHGVEVEIMDSLTQPISGRIRIQVRAKRRFVVVEDDDDDMQMQDGYTVANVQWLSLPTRSNVPIVVNNSNSSNNEQIAGGSHVEDLNTTTDAVDGNEEEQIILEMARALAPLVDEWKTLVRTGGWQRYSGQIRRCLQEIGPIPDPLDVGGAVDRALWVAALINPLPALGVAPEIRPSVLEHANDNPKKALEITTEGIERSLDHIKPNELFRWIHYNVYKWYHSRFRGGDDDELGPAPPMPGMGHFVKALGKLFLLSIVCSFLWSEIVAHQTRNQSSGENEDL